MTSTRIRFPNSRDLQIAAIIDWPEETPKSFALFAHCFTCTKDLKAIVKISRRLAKQGFAVCRFDFTGLGSSQGIFAETNFETNQDDIRAAVKFLGEEHSAPQLLIGHSLGGAAMISVAREIESARAISTVASPSNTHHLARFLLESNPEIGEKGRGDVTIGGRTYLMTQQLIDSLKRQDMVADLAALQLPFLAFHSPSDETLAYRHAEVFYESAAGPTSVVTLDGSDHLLVKQPEDAHFVADMMGTWAARYCT